MGLKNPKILHRIFFDDMASDPDPFERFLKTWEREMPDYEIMRWNSSNVDLHANEWVTRAVRDQDPVFISEYARWVALREYGGMYLDADCEILNGRLLARLIDELYESDQYDAFVGIEDYSNGHPTAQTVAAKSNSDLVDFMCRMYDRSLSGPLWHWREERGLVGPQLMSLYFREHGQNMHRGFLAHLDKPMIFGRVKIYTEDYFSPKFSLLGEELKVTKNTCVYHLFANLNVDHPSPNARQHRNRPMLFHEYQTFLLRRQQQTARASGLDRVDKAEPATPRFRDWRGRIRISRVILITLLYPSLTLRKVRAYLTERLS